MADTRDYRSVAYRQALLDQMQGGQYGGMDGGASYTMAAPFQTPDDPLAQYKRREEGAGGFARGAAGGAAMGATVGSMAPGVGTLFGAGVGALAGGIGGAFTKNAESAMTDFRATDARDAIGRQYQSTLGRSPRPGELDSQLAGQGFRADQGHQWVGEAGLRSVLDSIQQSPEAAQYRGGGALPTAGNSVPGTGPPAAGSVAPTGTGFTGGSGAAVDPYALPAEADLQSLLAQAHRYEGYDASTGRTGFAGGATGAGGYQYGGFDFAQDASSRDIGKSAKYAFSHFAEQAAQQGAPMPRTKADAEAWFNQYVAPGLQAAGYEIGWVKGDKARIKTREGWDEIDFVAGADGDNPTLSWQSEVLAPGGGMSTGPAGGVGGAPVSGGALTSSALFDQLMAQVRDIAAGKSNGAMVTDTNALINLLMQGA